jgi:hypothetical protein
LPALLEGLVEFGLPEVFEENNRYSWPATFGYLTLGLGIGALSIWLFPKAFVKRPFFPGVSPLLSPFTGGLTMAYLDKLIHKHEARPYIKFIHGIAFTFPIAILRFVFAQ